MTIVKYVHTVVFPYQSRRILAYLNTAVSYSNRIPFLQSRRKDKMKELRSRAPVAISRLMIHMLFWSISFNERSEVSKVV